MTMTRCPDGQGDTAMAGNDTIGTHMRRRHATRRAVSATPQKRWSRLAVLLAPALALAAFPVLAVESPPGFVDTVTSALHRAASIVVDPDQVLNSVETDVAANPGSSGGALVNSVGPGGAGHIQNGALRQRGAVPAMEPIICVRRVCNPKE
jgi:hypothetical protein